ncbi:MAG: hypothetical protein E2O51_04275, partial [Gammaproteobacteria bacterium]
RFDLPIALGVLKADRHYPWQTDGTEFIGELALNGELRPVQGVLLAVLAARDAGRAIIIPAGNAPEAALVDDATIYPAGHLCEVVAHLDETARLAPLQTATATPASNSDLELADVRGQSAAKRALIIAAAGDHNLLLIGPPGAGKSMLAQRLPGLLPPLSVEEMLCVASIASIAAPDRLMKSHRAGVRSEHRITAPPLSRWSVAATARAPERSRWLISVSCFWTSCPSSSAARWRRLDSRSKPALLLSPVPARRCTFRPHFSSSPQ